MDRRAATINGSVLVSGDGGALGPFGDLRFAGFDVQASDGQAVISGGAASRSVTAYGATGNGLDDDTAAIQAAIDVGPGIVTFPPGTYLVSSIVRNSGVLLKGSGVPGTVLSSPNASGPIIQSPAPAYAPSPTVRAGGVWDMLIDGGGFAGSVGISMSQNFNAVLSGLTIQNCETGVRIENSAYWNILESVRCAAVDDGIVVTNNANQNLILGCNVLACERGAVVEEGPDAGCSNNVFDTFAVEQFTVAAVDLITTVANAVDNVAVRNTRIENAVLVPGLPGVQLTGTVRGVDIIDPLIVNCDNPVANPLTDTRILWRAQEKNGVRFGVRNDFTTTSHALMYWVTANNRVAVRNSTDSTFQPMWMSEVYLTNGVSFSSGSGSPENVVARPAGSIYTDEVNGDLYRKTTSAAFTTGWVLV